MQYDRSEVSSGARKKYTISQNMYVSALQVRPARVQINLKPSEHASQKKGTICFRWIWVCSCMLSSVGINQFLRKDGQANVAKKEKHLATFKDE